MAKNKEQTRPEAKEVDQKIQDLARRKPEKKPGKAKPKPSKDE